MNTTLLFIELLITGLHAMIWLSLFVLTIAGFDWLQAPELQKLSSFEAIITALIFALAYVLGIVLDRLADAIFNRWNKRIGNRVIPNAIHPISVMRFELGNTNTYLNQQFEYTRSRMRITRAATINNGLATLFAAALFLIRIGSVPYALLTVVLGGILTIATTFAWRTLTFTYYEMVASNYPLLKKASKTVTTTDDT